MAVVNDQEFTALSMLIERLSWPVKLVRWRAAREIRKLLHTEDWADITRKLLIDWISSRSLESEVASGLSVFWVTDPKSRPQFAELSSAIKFPSLSSDFLLEQMYGSGVVLGGWNTSIKDAPDHFEPAVYFTKHCTQDIPPFYSINIKKLEERTNLPFMRQWAYEWEHVRERSSAPFSSYPYYFGDVSLARSGLHPQVLTRQSEVYRSAYQRVLAHSLVQWGLHWKTVSHYALDTLSLTPGLFELDPQPRPEWIKDFDERLLKEDVDLEKIARLLINEANDESSRLVSLKMPTPTKISEFGEISISAFFISSDFQPKEDVLSNFQRFLFPDRFGVRGDLPEFAVDEVIIEGSSGIAIPVTFDPIPFLHGAWHDEILSLGMTVPSSYCFERQVKFDVDQTGIFLSDDERTVGRTTIWLDSWTPLNLPIGGTRCGLASFIAKDELDLALQRMNMKLGWQVHARVWQSKRQFDDLTLSELNKFFRD